MRLQALISPSHRPLSQLVLFSALLLPATAGFADTTSPKQAEAAKQNNLGTAMMNQQLLEKAAAKFADAYQLESLAGQG